MVGFVYNIMTTSEEDKSIPQDSISTEDEALNKEIVAEHESSASVEIEDSGDESGPDSSEKEDAVDMSDVDRASRAAKIAREMAKIKGMKSAYSAGTTIDLTDLTEDSDISTQNTLTDDMSGSQ